MVMKWVRWTRKQQNDASTHRVLPIEGKEEGDREFRDEELATDIRQEQASIQEADSNVSRSGNSDTPSTCAIIQESPGVKWRRRRTVSIYFITVALLFADMNLMAPNLTEIGEEFGFDENERDVKLGGLIALTFFFVGAPVSFLIGWLADSVRRSPLYALTVLFGEAACFATYFVQTYAQLFVTRTMTGISIGGAIPVIYSVLGDLYPANQRAAISALIFTGTGLGAGVGQALAGFLGEQYGWRLPFLVVSVPGFLCAGGLFFIKDPERGGKEAAKVKLDEERMRAQHNECRQDRSCSQDMDANYLPACSFRDEKGKMSNVEPCSENVFVDDAKDESIEIQHSGITSIVQQETTPSDGTSTATERENDPQSPKSQENIIDEDREVSWRTTWEMLKIPSVALTIIQAAPGALPFGFASVFLNDYFQENRGMTKEESTGILMTFGVGNALGVISGGVCGHRAYKRDARGLPLLMGTSLIVACVPTYLLINMVDESTSIAKASVVAVFAGCFAALPVPLERAILANVTVPKSRGRANSMLSIVDDLGKGLGPAIVSLIIAATDRQTAFNFSLLGWIVAGILSFLIACFVRADEDRAQEKVRESLEKEDLQHHQHQIPTGSL